MNILQIPTPCRLLKTSILRPKYPPGGEGVPLLRGTRSENTGQRNHQTVLHWNHNDCEALLNRPPGRSHHRSHRAICTPDHTKNHTKDRNNHPSHHHRPKTLYAIKYVDTVIGTGPLAESSVLGTSLADSKVKWYSVRYTGWLTDGTKFDSSYDHPGGEAFPFPQGVHRVIMGWDSGFQGMHIGGKRRLFIPYQLAYGEAARPPKIPAKSDLIFDIELVSISDTPPEQKQPTAPPANPSDAPAKPTDPAAKPTTPPPTDSAKPETTPHPQTL
jgi:peptidylprolyl isomerase